MLIRLFVTLVLSLGLLSHIFTLGVKTFSDCSATINEDILIIKNSLVEFHKGFIFPVGDEPSGTSWTGFHSFQNDSETGYLLVFREKNPNKTKRISLPYLPTGEYKLEVIAGAGDNSTKTAYSDGTIEISLPDPNSFMLMEYRKLE